MEKYGFAYLDFVNIICPINQHSWPNHQEKYGEINPMEPANGERVLIDDSLHEDLTFLEFGILKIMFNNQCSIFKVYDKGV